MESENIALDFFGKASRANELALGKSRLIVSNFLNQLFKIHLRPLFSVFSRLILTENQLTESKLKC